VVNNRAVGYVRVSRVGGREAAPGFVALQQPPPRATARLSATATPSSVSKEERGLQFDGGPHNIAWTHPDEVNKALLDFTAVEMPLAA
jgi:hypothetical protein